MRALEEKKEVMIHGGSMIKPEERNDSASNGQLAREVQMGTVLVIKTEGDLKGVYSTLPMAKEEEERKYEVQAERDRDMRRAMKAEELAPAEVLHAESYPPIFAAAEVSLQEDEEEWEEKVRRDIEG